MQKVQRNMSFLPLAAVLMILALIPALASAVPPAGTGTIIITNQTIPPSTGVNFDFFTRAVLTTDVPGVGPFITGTSIFGPQLSSTGVTGNLEVANPFIANPLPLINNFAGKIAVIGRGTIGFATKVKRAQDAGASAVIIINHILGGGILNMGGLDPTITIPSIFISQADGATLLAALSANPALNATMNNQLDSRFTLQHGGNTTFSNVPDGTYTVEEDDPFFLGYKLTSLTVADPTNNSSANSGARAATIVMDAGETVSLTFTNTFTNERCNVDPQTDTKIINTQYTLIYTLTANGTPLPGFPVDFGVVSGPNAGKSSVGAETDVNGKTTFTYTGDGGTGTDRISIDVAGFFNCQAEVEWVKPAVIFATNSVWLKERSRILSGGVIVNNASPGPTLDSPAELSLAERATTPSGYALMANRVRVGDLAVVGSDVFYNNLRNKGTISGPLHAPLSMPVFTSLPPFRYAPAGTVNKTVAENQTLTLASGDYRELVVKDKGTVVFSGGVYNLRNLDARGQVKLLFAAASEVRIADKFRAGERSIIGPKSGSGIGAADIVFYVKGVNGSSGTLSADPKAASVGENSNTMANFYVPNGTLWIREKSSVTGAFFARDVMIGEDVNVTLGSAFSGSLAKLGGQQRTEGQTMPTLIPEQFGLEQNYPNPFNPTTTIRYALPVDAKVTLEVYDMLGRRVAELVKGEIAAGYHDVTFNASNLASGMYIYRIQSVAGDGKNFVQVRKLMLLK